MMSSTSITITKLLQNLPHPHLFLIQNCKNMQQLFKFHAHFIVGGLSNDTLFLSNLLSFTALSPAGDLDYAHLVLSQIHSPNTFMYNTMIRGYACSSTYPMRAISTYIEMFRSGLRPNNYTFPFLFKALSRTGNEIYSEILLCSVIKYGHILDLHTANSLLNMYANFGKSNEIMRLFEEIPEPDVVSWNVIIDDIVLKNGSVVEALAAFREMCYYGIKPNSVTLLGLVSACTKTGDLSIGRLIHLYIIKKGIHVSENLENGLLDMYAKFGDMESAEKVFIKISARTVFSWTSMVDGYVRKGEIARANVIFDQMPQKDTTAWNVMLGGFVEAGDMTSAETIFRTMPRRDVVSWNSLIVGYAQHQKYTKSLQSFKEMLISRDKPDRITTVGVLSVCAFAGALDLGEMTHSYMEKHNIKGKEVEVALINMYCKCGAPEKAVRVFDMISGKSVLTWSAMIVGLAANGLANEALAFFHQMCDSGIEPNEVTFIGVLCACSYAGLVEEGKHYFKIMSQIYGIAPRSEHFGCMADILGRAGLLKEAEMFIQNLPVMADAGIWGALLGACRMHGEVEMGEKVAKILTNLDPHHSGRYILLCNIYAAENRWFDAEEVRKKMKASRIQKTPGISIIGLRGDMHQFLAGSTTYHAGMRSKKKLQTEISTDCTGPNLEKIS